MATAAEPAALIATCWTTAGDVRADAADNLGRFALDQRVRAAAEVGYGGSGFWLGDLLAWRAAGRTYAELRRLLEACGQTVVELEFLTDWHAGGARGERARRAEAEFIRAAGELGARHIKVMPPFLPDDATGPALAEAFAALCARLAPAGLAVGLEMLPFSRLPTLGAAHAMVAEADAPNGGLLIDVWHVVRSGGTMADVAQIPARHIVSAELCDAAAQMQGPITEDTMCHRRLCGTGDFDLRGFIAALDAAGYRGPYGVEILSDSFRRLPLDEAARSSFATSAAQFAPA